MSGFSVFCHLSVIGVLPAAREASAIGQGLGQREGQERRAAHGDAPFPQGALFVFCLCSHPFHQATSKRRGLTPFPKAPHNAFFRRPFLKVPLFVFVRTPL